MGLFKIGNKHPTFMRNQATMRITKC
jgi:hypothetical protein